MMHRTKGWETRLVDVLNRHQETEFVWGQSDCAHLMGDAVRASHPKHRALKALKRYSTQRGAQRILKRAGGLSAVLGEFFEEIPKLQAQQGDIAVVSVSGYSAGCVIMDGAAIGKSEHGTFRVPLSFVEKAFRV